MSATGPLAVATLGRDLESLRCEASMERSFDERGEFS
jgi:hypothetical protein